MTRTLHAFACAVALGIALPVAAQAETPTASALHNSSVYLFQATPGATGAKPLFESFRVVRLPGGDYRFMTPNDDGVTLHATIEGDRLTAVTEGPGVRLTLIGTVDGTGNARGRFSVTNGAKVVADGTFNVADVTAAPPKPVCPPDLAAAGWGARKGKCLPPDFPAETIIHQMIDGVNMWQRFCTLKGGTGICLPVNMSATLFAWDPDPRLGNAVPLAGQGQTSSP